MKVVIIGQGNPYIKNPYLSKLAEVLDKEHREYEFWMWFRDGGGRDLPKVRALFTFGVWGGGVGSILGYMFWMARLFAAVLVHPRDAVFFCSRFDAALPCALASVFRPLRFVFLDRDKLSKSYSWPASIKMMVERIEALVEKRALLHVVPGESRVGQRIDRSNIRVVRNTPHSAVIKRAHDVRLSLAPRSGKLRVLVSGLISEPRGAAMTRRVAESLKDSCVEFVAAGRLLGTDADRFARLLGNRFLGVVSNEEALSLIIDSDVVLAFYDPSLEINRLAESNKWFDCAALGVPFVTNFGLLTSKPFEEARACFQVDYDDSEALKDLLLHLAAYPAALEERRKGLGTLRYPPWDVAMSEVIRECASLVSKARV